MGVAGPRGRRTRHVVVYLSATEAAAWDTLRSIQVPFGTSLVSRAEWVMMRVVTGLESIERSLGADCYKDQARAALAALDEEERRLGPVDETRAHGHRPQARAAAGAPHVVVGNGGGRAADGGGG